MKIGIDCRTILNPAGGESAGVSHYTYYLVKNLLALDKHNEYVLFFNNKFEDFKQFEAPNVAIKVYPLYRYKKYLPIIYSQVIVSFFLNLQILDLLHCPANIIPFFYCRPTVVTIHDLAIYKYPKLFPVGGIWRQPLATKILVPTSLVRANRIIAVSESTKRDIVDLFAVDKEKIIIVYEGTINSDDIISDGDYSLVKEKFNIGENYFLFVGSVEPRKNLLRLIRAFKNLKLIENSPIAEYQLILAGGRGWKNEEVFQEIEIANSVLADGLAEKPIKYLGYISAKEKTALMSRATAFIFPSLYEGFGLPVLEAMNLSVPVIASNTG